ncbi:MAG: ParB/RepB/Spo0J family partition protein [Anaerolineales bacterium]|nr:ParB/RepB/Spo0J family partition protein [Anaerolineales bacterium]
MPSAKRGLGRGLDALIPGNEPPAPAPAPSHAGVTHVPVTAIGRNPRQPRARLDPTELEELANSIREHGVIQPLIVAQTSFPGQYTLIAGERRLEASKLAGLAAVPVLVREATEQQLLEVALVENIQRSDLGPLETALSYKHLVDDFGLSHEAIAAKVGKKRVTVTNTMRLLKLPQRLLEALAAGEISEGHARALLTLPTPQGQLAAFGRIQFAGLNVRQTEELVRRMQGVPDARPPRPPRSAESDALTDRLRDRLGTKVTLKRGRKGGSLTLYFGNDEDLNALATAILGE